MSPLGSVSLQVRGIDLALRLMLSVANQFVGYLTPNLLDDIHDIADAYTNSPPAAGSDASYFLNAVRDTTDSIVDSNSGSQVTYAYKVANCLDTLTSLSDVATASKAAQTQGCLDAPDGPKASVRTIVDGYIQQIDGVLPPSLAAKIEASGVQNLDPSDPDYAQKVDALHQQFMKTDVGPEYVTCFQTFEKCLFHDGYGALAAGGAGNTQQTCLLGPACQTQPDGSPNPTISRRAPSLSTSTNRRRQVKTFLVDLWNARHTITNRVRRTSTRSNRSRRGIEYRGNRYKRTFAASSAPKALRLEM